MPGHRETRCYLIEECELLVARMLYVVAGKLDEVGPNERRDFIGHPERDRMIVAPRLVEVEIAGPDEGDGL